MHAAAPADQARRNHLRVIQDQTIARIQKARKFAKHPIFPAPIFTIQNQHARTGPVAEWFLRDAAFRQVIIELGEIQTSRYQCASLLSKLRAMKPPRPWWKMAAPSCLRW